MEPILHRGQTIQKAEIISSIDDILIFYQLLMVMLTNQALGVIYIKFISQLKEFISIRLVNHKAVGYYVNVSCQSNDQQVGVVNHD